MPLLRKDFIVDATSSPRRSRPGADAILLIVAALDAGELADLHDARGELGLAALVEVHDAAELAIAAALGAPLIGINNRDLTTLQVDLGTDVRAARRVPAETIVVAESGLRDPRGGRGRAPRASTPCCRRGADARPGHRGCLPGADAAPRRRAYDGIDVTQLETHKIKFCGITTLDDADAAPSPPAPGRSG